MEALAGGKSPKRPARDRISSFLNFLEEHERVFNLLYSAEQSV